MVTKTEPTLFSYIVKVDWGFAPNPFWGCCTLVCCKGQIRREAKEGDWVLGTGSISNKYRKNESLAGKIIYAMKVTKIVSMRKYYDMCTGKIKNEYFQCLKNKIPNWDSKLFAERMGDCIYYDISDDYTEAKLIRGAHGEENKERDLKGKNALISNHFYYFGKNAKSIKESLLPVVMKGIGRQSKKNTKYVEEFIDWIESGKFEQFRNPSNPQPLLEKYKDRLPER